MQGVTRTGRSDEDCDVWTECYAVCRVLHRLDGLMKTDAWTEWCYAVCRVLHRLDGLMKTVAAEAVQVTQSVCLAQNVIRRRFVNELKRTMSDALQVKKDWQQLILQLMHERSVTQLFTWQFCCTAWATFSTLTFLLVTLEFNDFWNI